MPRNLQGYGNAPPNKLSFARGLDFPIVKRSVLVMLSYLEDPVNISSAPTTGSRSTRIFACLGIALISFGISGCSKAPATAAGSQKKGDMAVPVTVAKVSQKDVPVELQVIGNVEAYATITVKAQVGGEITEVRFKEGDYVKKGDLLFKIDPRPINAQISQAEANQAKSRALLAQAQANLARDSAQAKYLESQARRISDLVKQGIMSREQGEQSQSAYDAYVQTVNADLAAIESAKAEINATSSATENLRVQLGYTEIRSPINGRTGSVLVKQGNIVSANTMDLVTINQVEPIYVTFAVPEAQYSSIKQYMARGKLPVIATPQDDESTKETGVLTFTDNNVNMTTGTIKLKGTFPNTDHKLWPGQFVRVVLRLTTQKDALLVPNQAVQTGQEGSYVFVVKADKTVESRPVKTGARVEQDMVVESGLEPGETVVMEGQLRLAPGSKIALRDGRGGGAGAAGTGRTAK